MSLTRQQRILEQIDRVAVVFDDHPGGVSRWQLAEEATLPETSVSRLMPRMRGMSSELGHIPAVLKIGGVWIYGWADTMRDHSEEHYKRRKNERKSLRLSIAMLEQSTREHPDSAEIRDQLRAAKHRHEDVEAQMERLRGVLSLLREETTA